MIELTPFRPADLVAFPVQAAQQCDVPDAAEFAVEIVRRNGEAVTVRGGSGQVVMVFGIIPQSDDLGSAWALFSADAGRDMLAITRTAQLFLDTHDLRAIMITVDMRHAAFSRWARMLGFQDRGMVQWQNDPDLHLFLREKI